MLKISWKEKVTNASVLEKLKRKMHVEHSMGMKTQMAGAHV